MTDRKRQNADSSASSRKQRGRVITTWRDVFREAPYPQYFAGLNEATDLNHRSFFRFISPPYNKRDYWEDVWVGQILKIVQNTDVQPVKEQHQRLTNEWEQRGFHDDVWLEFLAEERTRLNEELNVTNQMNAKVKAVNQLNAAMGNLMENAVEAFSTSQEGSQENIEEKQGQTVILEYFEDSFDLEQDPELNHILEEDSAEIRSEAEVVLSGGAGSRGAAETVSLHDVELPSSDPCDPSFTTELASNGTIEEEPEPVRLDRLVGPGTLSCTRTGEADYINDEGCNVSSVLMRYRREQIEDSSFLENSDVENILSLNFIFFGDCLHPLREQYRKMLKTDLAATEVALIIEWSQAAVHVEPDDAKATLCEIFARGAALKSPVFTCLDEMCGTGALWSSVILNTDNEDSHIARFVRPFVESMFGNFRNCKLCWTRDRIVTGKVCTGEMLQPDFMLCSVSKPQYTFMVGEVKKFEENDEMCHRDRVKLFTQMKMSLDGLLDAGVDGPVIGILAHRHRVEVWSLTLPFEALYLPTLLGAFDLVLSRFSFASTIVMFPPLLAARAAVADMVARFTSRRKRVKPVKTSWRRGTYHVKPQEIDPGVTLNEEVRFLWEEEMELRASMEAETEKVK
ncbi:hypothetical protein EMPS_06462 [Entomortierella parvispora]|uniref:Uncharacterized protein n=1 Tax=Entomortierella parvispora TaxID=205924 RepID=A0A9P3HCB7_9FUNG|nr:hypothetical protein EMPS_06462 [Entomortierella parvispora]